MSTEGLLAKVEEITAAIAKVEQQTATHTPDVLTTAQWQDFKQQEKKAESKMGFRMPGSRLLKPRSFDKVQSEAGYLGSLTGAAAPVAAAPPAAPKVVNTVPVAAAVVTEPKVVNAAPVAAAVVAEPKVVNAAPVAAAPVAAAPVAAAPVAAVPPAAARRAAARRAASPVAAAPVTTFDRFSER